MGDEIAEKTKSAEQSTFSSRLFKPGNDTLGYILFLVSLVLWAEGKNLRSVNVILVIIAIFWLAVRLLSKTKLFTKKEKDLSIVSKKRKLKLLSLIIVVLVAIMVLATTIVVNFSEDFGGEAPEYDSPNYKDGVFENIESTSLSNGDTSTWDTLGQYMVSDNCRSPDEVLPSQEFELKELEDEEFSVSWFGHSTVLLHTNEFSIITDPVFSTGGAGPLSLGPSPFPYEDEYTVDDLPEIDYVFISHDHYDHLDKETVRELSDSLFYVPLGVKFHLMEWGIDEDNVFEFDWYDESNVSDELFAAFAPSRHFSGRGLTDNSATLWGSWIFKFYDYSIYFSGDTGYMEEFKNISAKYGPFDLAFLDSGQYNIAWEQVHMLPNQVIQAAIDLNASVSIPIHISKYELALHHWYEPMELVSTYGAERNVTIATPMLGSTFIFDEEVPQDTWWRGVTVCTDPFLDDYPLLEYALIYTGVVGILWVAIPRFADRRKSSEEE
jgi:L-ascorbate metabolism protein UlaG (beta-lactamase superfamily)